MAVEPRTRKNIDSLTPQELADYEHAFTKLKEISDADPQSIDGLQYFTDLHNTMLGPCEHATTPSCPGTARTSSCSRRRSGARTRHARRT